MSVICECISVIVRVRDVEARYPGGLQAYELDCPNDTYCADGHLTRIGFMTPWTAEGFIDRLMGYGFVFVREGAYVEVAVIDQHSGLARPCWWLRTVTIPRARIACLADGPLTPVMAPSGWTPDRAEATPLHITPQDEHGFRLWALDAKVDMDSVLES